MKKEEKPKLETVKIQGVEFRLDSLKAMNKTNFLKKYKDNLPNADVAWVEVEKLKK